MVPDSLPEVIGHRPIPCACFVIAGQLFDIGHGHERTPHVGADFAVIGSPRAANPRHRFHDRAHAAELARVQPAEALHFSVVPEQTCLFVPLG